MHAENYDHIIDLIPAFALGALDDDEAAAVAEHLMDCAACRAELVAYESVADLLSLAVPHSEVSPALKNRLMARLRAAQTQQTAVPPSPSPWQRVAGLIQNFLTGPRWQPLLALAASLLLAAALVLWQRGNLSPPVQVELQRTEAAPDASGVIEIVANGRDASLTVAGLPVLSPERQYQLWLVKDDQRTSGAVFSVNDNGWARVDVAAERPFSEFTTFGVTIEPAGGSPGPTGERVLGQH